MRPALVLLLAASSTLGNGGEIGATSPCPGQPALGEWLSSLERTNPGAASSRPSPAPPGSRCEVEAVLPALGHPSPRLRGRVALLLGESGVASDLVVPALARLLRDPEPSVRGRATLALVRQGLVAAPTLVAVLKDSVSRDPHPLGISDPPRRASPADYAVVALSALAPSAIPVVLQGADPESHYVQRAVPFILISMGSEAIGELRRYLETGSDDSRRALWAAEALAELAPGDPQGCRLVSRLAFGPEAGMRRAATAAAASCPVFPELLAAAFSGSPPVDPAFAAQVAWAAVARAPAEPAAAALRALADFAPGDPEIAAGIADLDIELEPGDSGEPMAGVLRDRVVPLLQRYLVSEDPHLRLAAIRTAGSLGKLALPLVAELTRLARNAEADAWWAALGALERLGPVARPAAGVLLELAGDPEGLVRVGCPTKARQRLGRSPPVTATCRAGAWRKVAEALAAVAEAEMTLATLSPYLCDPLLTDDAASALSTLGPLGAAATPELLAALVTTPRSTAVRSALAAIGTATLPALLELARGGTPATRAAALAVASEIASRDPRLVEARRTAWFEPEVEVAAMAIGLTPTPLAPQEAQLLGKVLLERPEPEVRDEILALLRSAGSSAAPAAESLRFLLAREADSEVQWTLFLADPTPELAAELAANRGFDFFDLEGNAEGVAPSLVPLLASGDEEIQLRVLFTMAEAARLPAAAAEPLRALLGHPEALIRGMAIAALRRVGSLSPVLLRRVERRLLDTEEGVRLQAAELLAEHSSATQSEAFQAVLTEQLVEDFVHRGLGDVEESLRPRDEELITVTASEASYPALRLPLGLASAHDVIDAALLGNDADTLGQVHERLGGALRSLGYDEQRLFAVDGGFALATKIERFEAARGTSVSPPERWTRAKLRPRSLREYLQALFFENPGFFRLFLFIVTPDPTLDLSGGDLTEAGADSLLYGGSPVLSEEIAEIRFVGRHCHSLIYVFEKPPGAVGRSVPPPDRLGWEAHLNAAGILAKLALAGR